MYVTVRLVNDSMAALAADSEQGGENSEKTKYELTMFTSACMWWHEEDEEWRSDGVKVSEKVGGGWGQTGSR